MRKHYAVKLLGRCVIFIACVLLYPERFWDGSNEALKCSACTDKLCTQYCRKLRDRD